jgi:hypothetical protein
VIKSKSRKWKKGDITGMSVYLKAIDHFGNLRVGLRIALKQILRKCSEVMKEINFFRTGSSEVLLKLWVL